MPRCRSPLSGGGEAALGGNNPADDYISIVSYVDNPTIDNSKFSNLKLKDAIVDRIMKKAHRRPDSGPERTNIVINLYWKDDRAWLYLNTSGNKLADRGYRLIPHKAPMQETLAAAVMMATGYTGEMPLVAPMSAAARSPSRGASPRTARPACCATTMASCT